MMQISSLRLLGLYRVRCIWTTAFSHKLHTKAPLLQTFLIRAGNYECREQQVKSRRALQNNQCHCGNSTVSNLSAYMPVRFEHARTNGWLIDSRKYVIASEDFIFQKLSAYWISISKNYVLDKAEQDFSSHLDTKDVNDIHNDKFWEELETNYNQKVTLLHRPVDYTILDCINRNDMTILAVLYMKFLRRHQRKLSRTIVSLYIRICAKTFPEIALEELGVLLAAKNVPKYLISDLIHGFAESKYWRKASFMIMERIEKDGHAIMISPLVPMLKSLLLENDISTFVLYYNRTLAKHPDSFKIETIEPDIFNLWKDGDISIQTLLEVICKCGMYLDKEQAMEIVNSVNRSMGYDGNKLSARVATVHAHNGCCSICSGAVPKSDVTQEDVDVLQRYFQQTYMTLDRKNPDHVMLCRFKEFLRRSPKFDYILDMMNILAMDGTKRPEQAFHSIVDQLHVKGHNILAVGSGASLVDICEDTPYHFFNARFSHPSSRPVRLSTEGKTMREVYILLAAIHCGTHKTYIVSNDCFRDHRKVFNTEAQMALIKWQKCRQIAYMHSKKQKTYGKRELIFPYNAVAQEHERGWHIPFIMSNKPDFYTAQFTPSNKLICITKS